MGKKNFMNQLSSIVYKVSSHGDGDENQGKNLHDYPMMVFPLGSSELLIHLGSNV